MTEITVLIADGRPLTRLGLRTALETVGTIRVVGEAACDVEAVRRALALRPRVVVVDSELPEMGGGHTARRIRLESPETGVLILGDPGVEERGTIGFDSGRDLYVPNDVPAGALLTIVQQVAGEETRVDDAELRATPGDSFAPFQAVQVHSSSDSIRELTDREWQILGWVSFGQTNKEIAQTLALSEHTIKNHVRNILHKLGAKNRTAASIHFMERAATSPRPLANLSELLSVSRQ
jgi:DNA-binding NarL/FixJ family response regulator